MYAKFHVNNIIRSIDCEKIIKDTQNVIRFTREYNISIELNAIEHIVANMININEAIDKLLPIFDHNNLKSYVINDIIPNISVTNTYDNCTILDIMNKKVCKYKIGFSGTTMISLPWYIPDNSFEFDHIIPNSADNGAIYSGFLGLMSQRKDEPKIHKIMMEKRMTFHTSMI